MRVITWGLAAEVDNRRIDCATGSLRSQLVEYERGERRKFDVDMRFPGSFTGNVMRVMASIPYSETRAYGEVVAELDSHVVAVGQVCGWNSAPLIVPCHRVVGAGSLGGFPTTGGVDLKRALPDCERDTVRTGLDWFG